MKHCLRTLLLLLPLLVAGCGSSTNGPVNPESVSEEERRKFKEEEKRIEEMERVNVKGSKFKNEDRRVEELERNRKR